MFKKFAGKITLGRNSKNLKKVVLMVTAAFVVMTYCTIPAFAAAGFMTNAVNTLKIVVGAIGAGLAVWGIVNLLEGYGNDNAGAKSQGIKQLMAGGGTIILSQTLVPLLSGVFS